MAAAAGSEGAEMRGRDRGVREERASGDKLLRSVPREGGRPAWEKLGLRVPCHHRGPGSRPPRWLRRGQSRDHGVTQEQLTGTGPARPKPVHWASSPRAPQWSRLRR